MFYLDFQQIFLNALQSNSTFSKAVSTQNLLLELVATPSLIAENLPYVQAYQNFVVSYPYHYEITNLDAYCLIYTESGIGTLLFNNQTYTLTPDTLAFIDCRQKHRVDVNQSPWNYKIFFINGASIPFLYNTIVNKCGNLHTFSLTTAIPNMIKKLYVQLDKNLDNFYVQSKLIFDILLEINIEDSLLEKPNIPDYLVEIKNSLYNNYQNCISLDALEQEYHVSKYRICHEFNHFFHSSPIQYLNSRRIEVAKEALIHTDKRINEIGRMVGFENTNHFIRVFKQQNGVTPLIFRKHPPSAPL